MHSQARVFGLLARWQELYEQGRPATPEELCAGDAALADDLKSKLRALGLASSIKDSARDSSRVHQHAGGAAETPSGDGGYGDDNKPAISETVVQGHSQTSQSGPDTATDASISGETAAVPGYEILDELGRGGMGVVYKARQVRLNRLVAVKMILGGGHAGAKVLARFRTEAEAVARLQHPHIVQVYEIGEHQGLPYFSLEFCAGGSLAKKLAGTPMPPLEAVRLVETLARAMHFAHQKNIIHRDLKPHNVLLGENGEAKIGDFGLARMLDTEGHTVTGARVGTPSYMAPEQAAGQVKDIGTAADIYGLGAVFYECLTGRPPFRSATALDTVRQVLTEEPVPPSRFQAHIPRDVETICLKCLHKQSSRRYATALDLADDLRRVLNKEPIRARPVGHVERSLKWVRRRPLVAAVISLVSLIFVGSVVGIAVLAWYFNQLVEAREAAVQEKKVAVKAVEEEEKARKVADAEKLTAQQQSRRAESVARFMRDLFGANDPMGLTGFGFEIGLTPGKDLSAHELLDRGVKRINKELADDPLTRAALLDTLGDVYRSLGHMEQAGPLLENALAIRREHLVSDHPDVGESLTHLGTWLCERGEVLQGVEVYRQALDVFKNGGAKTELSQAHVLLRLAFAESVLGDDASELHAKQGLDLRMKHLDKNHRDVAVAKAAYAAALLDQEKGLEALTYSVDALTSLMARGEPELDAALNAVLGFQQAMAFSGIGQHAWAEDKLRESVKTFRKIMGPDHVYHCIFLYELAQELDAQGKLEEAENTFEECARVARITVGMGQPRSSRLVDTYGTLLVRVGKFDKARKLYEESLQSQQARFPGSLDWNLGPRLLLGEFEAKYGDLGKAEDIAREVLKRAGKRSTLLSRGEVSWFGDFARGLGNRGNLDLVGGLYDRAIQASRKRYGEAHPSLFDAQLDHGVILVNRKKYSQADPSLRQALELAGKLPALSAARIAELHMALGQMEWAAGNLAAAEEWFVKTLKSANTPQTERLLSSVLEKLCCIRIQQGRFDDVVPLLQQQQRVRIGSPFLKAGAQTLEVLVKETTGDSAGARQAAEAMVKLHGASPHPDIRAYMARVLALVGTGKGDTDLAAALDHAEAGAELQLIPHTRYALALCELRAGQPAKVPETFDTPKPRKTDAKPTLLADYVRAHAAYDMSPSEPKREAVLATVRALETQVQSAALNRDPGYNYYAASQTLGAGLLSRDAHARLAASVASHVPYPAIKRLPSPRQDARVRFQVGSHGEIGLGLLDRQGKWQSVTYEMQGSTSSIVVKVDGQTAPFGSGAGSIERKSAGNGTTKTEVIWTFAKIKVTEIVELHASDAGKPDVCLVRFDFENLDKKPHRVGLRQLIDTCIAGNDGHVFALPDATEPTRTQTELKGDAMPHHVRALEKSDLKAPGLVAVFTLKPGGGLDVPDRVALTHWLDTKGLAVWEVPVRDIGNDAALAIYWEPIELGPGERRSVGFACGHAPLSLPPAGGGK